MKLTFKLLTQNALAAAIQVVITAVVLFELYRFLIRELGPAQIGVWSLVLASASTTRLADFGLSAAVIKFVAADLGEGRRDQAASTVGMAALALGTIIGVVCILLIPVLSWLLTHLIHDSELLPRALALLPWALGSLWLATLAGVFVSALDASQRTTVRALVMTFASIIQLLGAYLVVPRYGLVGLGMAYAFQAAVTLLLGLFLSKLVLKQPWTVWYSGDRRRFRQLMRYGAGLQLATIGQMLFDPLAKSLMTVFGGLTATGYFEMANRAVIQFRAVVVAAYQMLVPYLAAKGGESGLTDGQVRSAYRAAHQVLFIIVTPYFAALGTVLPLLLTLWIGRFDVQFVLIGFACLAGWYANTLAVPAHMLYVALGRLRWIVWTHLAIGVLNLLLGLVGGVLLDGVGVALGAMTALALGSLVTVTALYREYGISHLDFVPTSSAMLLVASAISLVWTGVATYEWQGLGNLPLPLVFGALVAGPVLGTLIWRHPATQESLVRLRAKSPAATAQ